jgi:putative transposase
MAEILIPLEPDKFYHIYNHAVGKENFFENGNDYKLFLEKFIKYALPISDVFSFCLMPNHFHFAVRMKSQTEIIQSIKIKSRQIVSISNTVPASVPNLSDAISKQYSHLFNAYAKHFNYVHGRKGTLFTRAFRRKLIESEDYLKQLICYIHQNPVKAGYCKKPGEWRYSSYEAITGVKNTLVRRKEVIELFNDIENFIFCNSKKSSLHFE